MSPSGGSASGWMNNQVNNLSVPSVCFVKKLPCHNFFSSLFTSDLTLHGFCLLLHYRIRSNSLFKAIRHREAKSHRERERQRQRDRQTKTQRETDRQSEASLLHPPYPQKEEISHPTLKKKKKKIQPQHIVISVETPVRRIKQRGNL